MPQIVEVLKYVHEVCEVESVGVAVSGDVGLHEAKYKELSRNIEMHLGLLTKELRSIRDPSAKQSVDVIDKFLAELRNFILVPRIVRVV
jgi:hypothetical protein